MWFEELVGFRESTTHDVASQFEVDDEHLTSLANGRTFQVGRFETPSLGELRQLASAVSPTGTLRAREVVADVQDLHVDPANANALFQVASQFNTLEMVSPTVTPERGVDRYESDRTQGPACAIACGAGTIFRNYLVEVDGSVGQTADRQINCLRDLTDSMGIGVEMQNGYALLTTSQLQRVGAAIESTTEDERRALMGKLRIGMQWDTEVTLDGAGHTLTQAYCSALPVSHSNDPVSRWERFARLILDAAYEATLAAAVINATGVNASANSSAGSNRVYLTLLGGGVWGNRIEWIVDAITRSLDIFSHYDLDVAVVSYGRSNPALQAVLADS